jgi:hypothetical protein
VGRTERAVAAYRAYLAHAQEWADGPEVAFRIGRIYERDHRWKDALLAFDAFGKEYLHDPRVQPSRRYLAEHHQLLAALALHDARDEDALTADLIRSFQRLPPAAREEPEVLDAYAHARFLALEPSWRRYAQIQLSRVATMQADLVAKRKGLKELEKAYLEVLETGASEYGIAALTRIGLAYADLAKNIRTSPDPRGLNDEERKIYRAELEKLAQPIESKSAEVLEQGLAKAYELSLYGRWTLEAQGQLNRYRPNEPATARLSDYEVYDALAATPLEERSR